MSMVRIPADVDREDRILANLTARQLAILVTAAIVLYGLWTLTRSVLPLMNPLSSMGRGVKARRPLASHVDQMREIFELTAPFDGPDLDVTHIRFPNTDGKPLAGCEAGTIIYVFTPGEVTVCPYLVFAARTTASQHDPTEFIVGNIFTDPDIAHRLDTYRFHDRYQVGTNPTCTSCTLTTECGKGCPAAVIAEGGRIGDLDADQCPVTTEGRRLLPLIPA